MKTNLFTYYVLSVLVFISVFTIVIPTLYYVFNKNGYGYAHVLDLVHDRYNPDGETRWSNFFKPLY